MKRQPLRKVNGRLLTFLTVSCLFLCSCGIEQYYYIEAPSCDSASDGSTDISSHYATFTIREDLIAQITSLKCDGTYLYYRIYNDADKMNTAISDINTYNTDNSTTGFSRMTTTHSFVELPQKIPFTSKKKAVTLRLSSEGTYSAVLSFVSQYNSSVTTVGVPTRRAGNTSGFTFTDASKPTLNDVDYACSVADSTTVTKWYVPVYAVTSGLTAELTEIQSSLCYLGYFTIQQGN